MYSEEIEVDIPFDGPACGTLNGTGEGDTPVCVMFPGLYGKKGGSKYVLISDALEKGNIASLRFDPYHPKDIPPEQFLLEDGMINAECAILYLKELGYRDIGIMGSSMGANLALHYAAEYGGIEALVLRAPIITSMDIATLEKINVPALFIGGSEDHVFTLERAEEAMGYCRGVKELRILPGADHACKNEEHNREVARVTCEWLGRWLKGVEETATQGQPEENTTSFGKMIQRICRIKFF